MSSVPSQIFLETELTSASVVSVGGQCYKLVGDSTVAVNTSSVDAEYGDCDSCANPAPCTCPGSPPLLSSYDASIPGATYTQFYPPEGRNYYWTISAIEVVVVADTTHVSSCGWLYTILASDDVTYSVSRDGDGYTASGTLDQLGGFVLLSLNPGCCVWALMIQFGDPLHGGNIAFIGIKDGGSDPVGTFDGSNASKVACVFSGYPPAAATLEGSTS